MTAQIAAEALAPRLYAAYIESTGRLSYRGSSVLGLKDASVIDKMDERALWSALRLLKVTSGANSRPRSSALRGMISRSR